MKHLNLFVLFLLVSSLTFAQDTSDPFKRDVMLTATVGDDPLVFKSDSPIRYFADYSRYVVSVPEGVLASPDQVTFPASVVVAQNEEGLTLELGKPFKVTLSQDDHITLKTLVHELAHATLHQVSFINTDRHVQELEAIEAKRKAYSETWAREEVSNHYDVTPWLYDRVKESDPSSRAHHLQPQHDGRTDRRGCDAERNKLECSRREKQTERTQNPARLHETLTYRVSQN
jgi:hypothetical protein